MKNIYRTLVLFGVLWSLIGGVNAGNDNRRNTAGASQLLINPWARSTGWGGVNTANGRGLDALYSNVAGILLLDVDDSNATPKTTDIGYSNTILFPGSGLSMNAAGIVQMIGSSNALSLSFMSIGGKPINITTNDNPEFENGSYRTTNMNINVAYAHAFSASILGGINVKIVNEGTDAISAMGVAVDAGIQYVTGEKREIKFGIALKNIGSKMSFEGSGLSKTVELPGSDIGSTLEEKSQAFEMPTRLNIGASYDFLFSDNRLTFAGNFSSNAFSHDQFIVGAEWAFLNFFQLRSGYVFEKNLFNEDEKATAFSGLHAGLSIEAPLGKKKGGPSISLDYAFRLTTILSPCHTIGIGINL